MADKIAATRKGIVLGSYLLGRITERDAVIMLGESAEAFNADLASVSDDARALLKVIAEKWWAKKNGLVQ